ncbi:putative metallopeptidase [Paenibacillus sp. FSL W8-0426]|uniref:putative metallopeptidase n=1 Tax=Paenibacillus sp. FSL W8-0426 TaxID=2921714 RepID=UPI0030DDB58B
MATDKFVSRASEETFELLEDMIEKHHPHLSRNEFLIMMKHGGWKSKGKTKFSGVTVLNEAVRMEMAKDLILYLNADMWNKMSDPQKRYVLDHALFGLDVKKDKNKDVLEADDGRPLLKTLPPDIEAFFAVITRHGAVSEDVKRLAFAIKEVNVEQLTLETADVSGGEEQGGQQGPKTDAEGNILISDPNQAKIPLDEQDAAASIIATTQDGQKVPVTNDDLPF